MDQTGPPRGQGSIRGIVVASSLKQSIPYAIKNQRGASKIELVLYGIKSWRSNTVKLSTIES